MWISDLLFNTSSVAQSVFIVSIAAAIGLGLGNLKFRGIGLGISGCLFSGLLLGHFGLAINHEILEFMREFGLILFVYTVGLQVGPGFISALRAQGLRLNLLASAVVAIGTGMVFAISKWGGVAAPAAIGLFSGATTNTPSLGASQSILKDILGAENPLIQEASLGYAVAYPFGVVGIILTMLVLKRAFRISPEAEAERYLNERRMDYQPLETVNLEVTNPNMNGLDIGEIPGIREMGVVISRVKKRESDVGIATLSLKLELGDVILAVGSPKALKQLELIVGARTETDLRSLMSAYDSRKINVTRNEMAGKSLSDLLFLRESGAVVTRINRADVEFAPTSDVHLQFGDVVTVVGTEQAIKQAAEELGNSLRVLSHPKIVPIFIGLALGVLVGSIPFHLPGVPMPMKLGLAGGPMLVAIVFSSLRHLGPVVWHLPLSSNLVLREIGIALFLTCVGLKSGGSFAEILLSGPGLEWMAWGAVVTLIPLAVVGTVAHVAFRMNFMVTCGLLSGAMTDPPALYFANTLAQSDAPSVTYSTVYPLVMILRVFFAQALVIALT